MNQAPNKNLLFVFTSPPHGTSQVREGLDAALASSALSEDIAVLFVGDGVFSIVKGQTPQTIMQRHLLPTFGMLELYDVEARYVCEMSLRERSLVPEDLAIDVAPLSREQMQQLMGQSHALLRF